MATDEPEKLKEWKSESVSQWHDCQSRGEELLSETKPRNWLMCDALGLSGPTSISAIRYDTGVKHSNPNG